MALASVHVPPTDETVSLSLEGAEARALYRLLAQYRDSGPLCNEGGKPVCLLCRIRLAIMSAYQSARRELDELERVQR
jgi:hypothetical protein